MNIIGKMIITSELTIKNIYRVVAVAAVAVQRTQIEVPVSVGYPQTLLSKLLSMFMQVCSYEFLKSCRQGNSINELKTLITLRNNLVKLTCYTIKNLIIKKKGGGFLHILCREVREY